MKRRFILLAMALCLLVLVACGENSKQTTKNKSSSSTKSEDSVKPEEEESIESGSTFDYLDAIRELPTDYIDDSVTYDDLARTPDNWLGTPVFFTGEVVQMIVEEDVTGYRFAINGDYNQIIYVGLYAQYQTDILLEGDYAALSGVAAGMLSYESIVGSTITIPAVLAAKFEMTEIPMPELPEYPIGPLTLKRYYSTGSLWSTTKIESFSIVGAEISYNGDLNITCDIVGTISGSDTLSLDLKCYDEDGFLLKTATLYASVSAGEKFKVSNNTYIPANTSRIELATD